MPVRADAQREEPQESPGRAGGAAVSAGPVAERVVQLQRLAGNRAVAALVLARAEWAPEYKTRKTRQGLTLEQYEAKIGAAGAESYAPAASAASAWGGTRIAPVALTRAELGAIVLYEGNDDAGRAAHEKRLDDYLPSINDAFETMGLDTVESQASFLAHAGESGSFAKLTEVVSSKNLPSYYPFIGRGPIQVTFESGYIQSLAYVEKRGEELAAQAAQAPAGSDEAKRLQAFADRARAAVTAIKADITKAADPQYAFLFSSAFMHWTKGVKRSAHLKGIASPAFGGAGDEDAWVTNWTESFQTALDAAPERKKAAEDKLAAAQAKLAANPNDTAAQKDARDAQAAINRQIGTMREAPGLITRAKVKKAIYERAVKVLTPKAVKGAPAAATTAAIDPSELPGYERDDGREPWESPAFF